MKQSSRTHHSLHNLVQCLLKNDHKQNTAAVIAIGMLKNCQSNNIHFEASLRQPAEKHHHKRTP